MKKRIYGNSVLVTGASSGIGKAIAEAFARDGYTVYAVSRHIGEGERKLGSGTIIGMRADVTDRASLERIRERIGSLSILVNAAGSGIAGSAEDMDISFAREQMEVNYFGPLIVGNVFLPLLRRNPRSLVIFISSIAGRVPIPYQSHYSSSKYALEAYAEALRMEGKRHGLTTVLIEPGDTKTGFTSSRRKCIPADSVYRADAEKAIAKMEKDEMNGKSPETVAKAALSAASRRNPPVRKPVGAEYSFLMILLRILPDKAALWILRRMY